MTTSNRRPLRQRALRDAIAWSYDLLFPDDQRGLWALACFRGGAPLAATEAVTAVLGVPGAVTVDVLDRLADRSLVQVAVGADGAVRYHLLDSVREFSAEQADGAGVADLARSAHAAWFAGAAAQVGQDVRGPQQAERLSLVRTERANIDAALDWARRHDRLLALRIATGFAWAWAILGAGPDAAQRVRDCVAGAGTDAAAQDRATGLLLAGWLEATGGDLDVAEADLAAAISTGDADLGSIGRLYLAFVRSQQGRAHDALDLLKGCRRDFGRPGLEWELGASWLLTAWAQIALGDIEQGRAACERALHLLAPLGDQWALNHAEGLLGALAQAEHRFADATEHLRRAAAATNALGFAAAEAHHLANLGRAEQQAADARAAATTLQQSQEVARRAGDLRTAALAGVRLGRVLRALGEPQPARAAVEQADTWYRAAGGGEGGVLAQYLLAVLDLDDGSRRRCRASRRRWRRHSRRARSMSRCSPGTPWPAATRRPPAPQTRWPCSPRRTRRWRARATCWCRPTAPTATWRAGRSSGSTEALSDRNKTICYLSCPSGAVRPYPAGCFQFTSDDADRTCSREPLVSPTHRPHASAPSRAGHGTIRGRVARILALPAVVVLLLLGLLAAGQVQEYRESQATSRSVDLALAVQDLVHELQTERGVTAAVLGGNASFQNELAPARRRVDEQAGRCATAPAATWIPASAPGCVLRWGRWTGWAPCAGPRRRNAGRQQTFAYFTDRIAGADPICDRPRPPNDEQLRRGAAAVQAVQDITEALAQERAFLNGVFSAGGFGQGRVRAVRRDARARRMRPSRASTARHRREQRKALDFVSTPARRA